MRVLIACEFSGEVRDAFISKGHEAWSCDLLPSDKPGPHIQDDVLKYINPIYAWDMLIGFPPCTFVCFAGIRWNVGNQERQGESDKAIEFFKRLYNSKIAKICIENPVGIIPRKTGIKWTQMIHPWQFGHGEQKKTCLWLRGLPPLQPTNIVEGREQRMFKMGPSVTRSSERSKTFPGIAQAMAQQWG